MSDVESSMKPIGPRVQADQAGDHPQIGLPYPYYAPLVWSVTYRMTRRAEVADRLTAAVFAEAAAYPNDVDATADSACAWFTETAGRSAREWLGREGHRTPNSERDPGPDRTGEDRSEVWESCERLERVLESLTVRARDAIILAYFGGRTHREVALDLAIPAREARTRIVEGLNQLAVANLLTTDDGLDESPSDRA